MLRPGRCCRRGNAAAPLLWQAPSAGCGGSPTDAMDTTAGRRRSRLVLSFAGIPRPPPGVRDPQVYRRRSLPGSTTSSPHLREGRSSRHPPRRRPPAAPIACRGAFRPNGSHSCAFPVRQSRRKTLPPVRNASSLIEVPDAALANVGRQKPLDDLGSEPVSAPQPDQGCCPFADFLLCVAAGRADRPIP